MLKKTKEIFTDLLIVGSGLAGITAALRAAKADPDIRILMVSQAFGPAGSSFCNINNAIGLQTPDTAEEKEAYIRCATAIARPGTVRLSLLQALMDDSPRVFDSLFANVPGLQFREDKVSGCFFKTHKTARILQDINHARNHFSRRLAAANIDHQSGVCLVTVFKGRDAPVIKGALFKNRHTPGQILVHCNAMILATGGFSPVTANALPAAYNLPNPIGMLADVGCKTINLPFLQYIWLYCDDKTVWPLWRPGKASRIIGPDGCPINLPDFGELMDRRADHVPGANGLADARIDAWLMQQCSRNGGLDVITGGVRRRVKPYIQACHGGLEINSQGETSLKGLFACGEAASGMHGANRIGGGMALACLVYGDRCGLAAIHHCHLSEKRTQADVKDIKDKAAVFTDAFMKEDLLLRQQWLPTIGGQLFERLILDRPNQGNGCDHFDSATLSGDWFLRQSVQTANLLMDARSIRTHQTSA